MTAIKGCDYSFNPHPAVAALKADGIRFVMRYASPDPANDKNGKNLQPAELHELMTAGFEAGVVFESSQYRMLGGHMAGVADARHLDAVVKALGMPGLPGFFACDFDATPSQQAAIDAYLDGSASVLGTGRNGMYGGFWPLHRAFNAGKITWAWQAYAWSLLREPLPPHAVKVTLRGTDFMFDTRAQLRQVHNGVKIGGADADLDEAHAADFGQWPRPAPPAPPSPPGPVEWTDWTAPAGNAHSLVWLARHFHTHVAAILRETAHHQGHYSPPLTGYLNHGHLDRPIPAGAKLRVPK